MAGEYVFQPRFASKDTSETVAEQGSEHHPDFFLFVKIIELNGKGKVLGLRFDFANLGNTAARGTRESPPVVRPPRRRGPAGRRPLLETVCKCRQSRPRV